MKGNRNKLPYTDMNCIDILEYILIVLILLSLAKGDFE